MIFRHKHMSTDGWFWVLLLCVAVLSVPFAPYLPRIWFDEYQLIENLQCLLLILATFCSFYLSGNRLSQMDRWLWLGVGMVFLLLVIRETNMLRGVLYPVDARWFGISNRTYTHFVMGVIGLTALNYLIKGKAQRWIPKGASFRLMLLSGVVLLWLQYIGEHGWLNLGDLGIIVEEGSELLMYVAMWVGALMYGKPKIGQALDTSSLHAHGEQIPIKQGELDCGGIFKKPCH